ncbi:ribonuclease activity regulator RraA [Oceanobacillus arenosus]|uniref:Putative 4-hydroxy-4-methyl-2-oxoglutarate aldolase n=1 Tax=Oceanobacillus arenosus TaxID=1229153 RepID=A0A3D8PX62_9BACI|nr:ribonuclease activity regulator RraA [Oceanobacillus arenosus]RDW20127.1 ribonuclease activity regulator RraA [Oceanobacillus arenosus]
MSNKTTLLPITTESKKKLQEVSTASLTSQLLKRGFRNTFIPNLTPTRPDLRMVGYAYTLRYVPAREDIGMEVDYDNDTNLQRIAVESIEDEHVLVIDARGELGAASFGHILGTRLMQRHIAGLVTDGALRDSPRFKNLDLPTYYQGVHATTSSIKHHPADINTPIGCNGVLVMPGDIIVGDAEGVVVIPKDIANVVAHDAYEQDLLEEFILKKVEEGASIKSVYPASAETLEDYKKYRKYHDHPLGRHDI